MPHIAVDMNDGRIATIDLSGLQVANVSVHGALDREPKAVLDAMGGNYQEGGCGHLVWVVERSLSPGDVVRVSLHAGDAVCDPGKTLAQLYPDDTPCTQTDFSITDAMADELRARPQRHAAFTVGVSTSSGQQAGATSDERNTAFTFSLLWDHFSPDRARILLATNCLDDVLARRSGTEHLVTTIPSGETASFTLVR